MRTTKLLSSLIITSFLFLQACSINSINKNNGTTDSVKIAVPVSASHKLANDLGLLQINDVVKESNKSEQVVVEHKMISEYTAATGRVCREIESTKIYAKIISRGIVCRDSSLQWYWPRQLVY